MSVSYAESPGLIIRLVSRMTDKFNWMDGMMFRMRNTRASISPTRNRFSIKQKFKRWDDDNKGVILPLLMEK